MCKYGNTEISILDTDEPHSNERKLIVKITKYFMIIEKLQLIKESPKPSHDPQMTKDRKTF